MGSAGSKPRPRRLEGPPACACSEHAPLSATVCRDWEACHGRRTANAHSSVPGRAPVERYGHGRQPFAISCHRPAAGDVCPTRWGSLPLISPAAHAGRSRAVAVLAGAEDLGIEPRALERARTECVRCTPAAGGAAGTPAAGLSGAFPLRGCSVPWPPGASERPVQQEGAQAGSRPGSGDREQERLPWRPTSALICRRRRSL